jgi:hypothetical protein
MNRLIIVVVLIVVVIAGVGFYQGWFNFTSESSDGKTHITLNVDKDKIQEDEKKVQEMGHKATDKVGLTTEKKKD